mmetsp:Transcript_20500/g.30539  ORF Transcript_20500/g.30539 Transcript_20500/m.30539 type:complete len:103 (-) Transcript_20500:20-328(-)
MYFQDNFDAKGSACSGLPGGPRKRGAHVPRPKPKTLRLELQTCIIHGDANWRVCMLEGERAPSVDPLIPSCAAGKWQRLDASKKRHARLWQASPLRANCEQG